MTLRKFLKREFGDTGGVEWKENFRAEEEDAPALLCGADSKAVSKLASSEHGVAAEAAPEQTHCRIAGQVSTGAQPTPL